MVEEKKTTTGNGQGPVIVDLGKKKKKAIKRLRRGEGSLMTRVNELLAQLRSAGTVSSSAQPVIVLVKQRSRRRLLG